MRKRVLGPVALLGLGVLLSCGDDGTGPPAAVATYLEAVGATAFEAPVAGQQELRVRVLDQERRGLDGVTVNFAVTGAGELSVGSTPTDAEGYAQTTWSFGTVAGAQQVTATVSGIDAVAFTATVRPGPAAAVVLTPESDTLLLTVLGSTVQLEASVVDSYGNVIPELAVSWSMGDELVARVDDSGLVTAVGRGTTTVRASYGSFRESRTVRVLPEPASLSVSPGETLLEALGWTAQLQAIVRDAGGTAITDAPVTWTSRDTSTVTVSAAGLVTAQAPGAVWVTANSGVAGDSALVTVHQRVYQIRILPDSAIVEQGTTRQFIAELRDPEGHLIERAVSWSSTDETIATIDAAGVLTGHEPGTAHVRADVDDATRTAGVLVHEPIRGVFVTSGGWHSCALATNLRAYCWGSGSSGRLGNGSTTMQTRPVAVSGSHVFEWIGAGYMHTCALRQDGAIYCWGGNTWGQAGLGTGFSANVPTAVLSGQTFTKLDIGDYHTCALRTDGTVWCWGLNLSGMAGVEEDHEVCGINNDPCVRTPVQAAPGMTFVDIATYRVHTCALTAEGAVYCWGSNLYGQLGDGSTEGGPTPRLVQGPGGFTSLGGGGGFHSCGLKADDSAWCWGLDVWFQLGNNMASPDNCAGERCSLAPMQVAGGRTFNHITTGYGNTCAVVPDDDAYCWGWNAHYALGDGTLTDRPVPTRVINASYKHVATGMMVHSVIRTTGCAVELDGHVRCWGTNLEGQVGDGTSGSTLVREEPVRTLPFQYRAPLEGDTVEAGVESVEPEPVLSREQLERVQKLR
jgi:alpha-tubulin suppressor-like RCC1 family protein/uncharacterized protein YjdB